QRERAAHAKALREMRENEAHVEVERAASEKSRSEAEEAGRVTRAKTDHIREALAESQRVEEDTKEQGRQAQRQAEEDRRNAKEAQEAVEAAAIEANERASAAKKGSQPVIVPSYEKVEAAKRKVQYMEGLFHFAVAGVAESGKSSLINAFRGLQNRDKAAAPTGVTETTLAISILLDPDKKNPFVWYDIPGAGTMKIKDWQYFNEQGFYVFDCIIVVFDNRLTMADIAILMNCKRFGIPTYIVRSESDTHIRNIMLEMGCDSDDDSTDPTWCKMVYAEAREEYIAETRTNIKQNLEDANLPDQKVYMVSNAVVLSIVKNHDLPPKTIDELELMRDLLSEAHSPCSNPGSTTTSALAAKQAQHEAEERLKKGIQPVVVPSHEQVKAAKRRVQYKEGLFHFAVAGVAGGGKSSLINAFRGLRNRDKAAAPTGVTETTLAISRLPDPNKENPFVWYDIPGAGTMKIKDWQYFNEQGLYVFDCIIVVFDSRFTMTDIATLVNCKRFGIPTYIVRSKSDTHIRNIMLEMGYDNDVDNADRKLALNAEAREEYITETRANIKQNLAEANLPDQKVYMVSNSVLLSIVKGQTLSPKIIDELELMRDLLSAAHSRRCIPAAPAP
ncbi:hypothetical protein PAXINDRAFT_90678, partial [Paxillus involutus ATCC 200175]